MAFTMKYMVSPAYLTKPSKRRSGQPMNPGVRFIVAHDTGNVNSTARNNVNYYENSRNEKAASAHLFVDDREILECIPALTGAPEKAWHVRNDVAQDNELYGFNANDAAIAVEYCYGRKIDADEAYRKYVWVIAYACDSFNLDPRDRITGHFILDPDRRTDPVSGLAHSRRTYEQLLRDDIDEYLACSGNQFPAPPPPAEVKFPKLLTTTSSLNIRRGKPSRTAPVHETVAKGTRLTAAASTVEGESVNNNRLWYQDGNGNFFWSGAVVERP